MSKRKHIKKNAVGDSGFNHQSLDSKEDIENDILGKKQRDAQLFWNQCFLISTICMAWIFGSFGFSIAWVLLLTFSIHMIMRKSFSTLLEECVIFEKHKVQRRKALMHNESAEWINFILNRWWLFSSTSIFIWLKQNIEPMINEASRPKLESVKLKRFSFGNKTPFVTSVHAFETNSTNYLSMSDSEKSDVIHSLRYHLVVEADVGVFSPEFEMILTGKAAPGVEVDIVFKNLKVIGQIQSNLQFSLDVAFPHISKATFTFIEKPNVSFDVKCLGLGPEITDALWIKSWFNSLIMEFLTEAIVDPFRLELNIAAMDYPLPAQASSNSLAEGVLTVTIGWLHKNGKSASIGEKIADERWCVLHLGEEKIKTGKCTMSSNLMEKHSLLVYKFPNDKIKIKIKGKKLIGTSTLAKFVISLIDCITEDHFTYKSKLQKKGIYYIYLRMQYEPLKPLHLKNAERVDEVDSCQRKTSSKAGVLYISIHHADGLPSDENVLPNPYCALFHNTKKIKSTHYITKTCTPYWESSCEFLVADISQSVIQLAVCNYDISKMADAGILGCATINLDSLEMEEHVLKPISIPLDTSFDYSADGNHCGALSISVLFRPSQSMEQSDIDFDASLQD